MPQPTLTIVSYADIIDICIIINSLFKSSQTNINNIQPYTIMFDNIYTCPVIIGECQENATSKQAARIRQCAGDVKANAWPPRCIAAGYSPDKGNIEFASLST